MKRLLLLLPFLCFAISLKAQNTVTIDSAAKNNLVFTTVEVQPEFPGGEEGLALFLQKNIKYPEVDKKKNIQGKVYLQFVVERDGSLSDFKIMRTPSKTITTETLRVFQLSPNWIPGKQNGKPVRVQFTLPINFSLSDR
jgi:protein TonB